MIRSIRLTQKALKMLDKCPSPIVQKLFVWVASVEANGLQAVRKQPGWHDEPLRGDRKGQRSIRLNRQWRAIYVLKVDGSIEFCEIIEVTPHDY